MPLLRGAPLSFTSDWTSERALEEPLVLAPEDDPDFLGLRLLTPLRPIDCSFLNSLNCRSNVYSRCAD